MFQWYKAMERAVITMNEHGTVFVPDGEVWMSEMELTDLFGVTSPTVRAAIRAVYKSGVLEAYEAQKYIRLENGYSCLPHPFIRCKSGTQCLAGEDVLAKRKSKYLLFAEYQQKSFNPAIIIR